MNNTTKIAAIKQQRRTNEGRRVEDRILKIMELGVVVTDADNQIIFANRAIMRISGYSEQELLDQNVEILCGPLTDQRILHEIAIAHKNALPYKGEILLYRKDGTTFWNEIAITPEADISNKSSIFIEIIKDISDKKNQIEKVSRLAFFDSLTNLPNRNLFNDRLTQVMHASKRDLRYGAIMFIDLDNFKKCNDEHGHTTGDLLLVEAANRMTHCVRQTDTVSRFGGDEFLIILSHLTCDLETSKQGALKLAERVRSTLLKPYLLSIQCPLLPARKVSVRCTASIGVVLFIDDQLRQDELIGIADREMYKAKKNGGNQISYSCPDTYKLEI